MAIADGIREILDERKLSQRKVAAAAGFSDKQFSAMLCGTKLIRIEYIPRICKALGVTPNELFARAKKHTTA